MKVEEEALPIRLAVGLDSDNERTQIITSNGWHVCYIEYDPHLQLAQKIVNRYNREEPDDGW